MKDKIGRLPIIKTKQKALKEIYKIANDTRHHVLLADENDWLMTKIMVIRKICRFGFLAS